MAKPTEIKRNYPHDSLLLADLPGEIWKDMAGFEGYYQISNQGRIKALERTIFARYNRQVNYTRPPAIRKPIYKDYHNKLLNMTYYSLVFVTRVEKVKQAHVIARLVYTNFVGKIGKNQKVLHKDLDSLNNCVENLFLGTATDVNNRTIAQGRTNVVDVFKRYHHDWPEERRQKSQQKSQTKIQVSQYDLKGFYLTTYNSIQEALRQTGCLAIRPGLKTEEGISLSGGYLWQAGTSQKKIDITVLSEKIHRYGGRGKRKSNNEKDECSNKAG